MAKKRDITPRFLAIIPAVAALFAGATSALQPENIEKFKTYVSNPLNAGIITVYAAAILVIVTTIVF
jgi:hypothetical protein